MSIIVNGPETTNEVIHLKWTEPDNGGSPVLGYIVYYKQVGDSEFTELVG
jgi:hypothetical protein